MFTEKKNAVSQTKTKVGDKLLYFVKNTVGETFKPDCSFLPSRPQSVPNPVDVNHSGHLFKLYIMYLLVMTWSKKTQQASADDDMPLQHTFQ